MAENNPIKYSDLIAPDDSLQKLTNQLHEIADALQFVKKEAVSLDSSMKTMSGSTKEGRGAIAEASKEAEKLAKAQQELAFAESETAKKIAALKEATREQNNLNKLAAKEANSAKDSYNALSAQYSRLKMQINQMSEEERKNTKVGKEMVEESKRIYEKMKEMQEATGKTTLNVGNYSSALDGLTEKLGGLPGPIGSATQGIKNFAKAAKAFIATPLGIALTAIVGAFGLLKNALSATEQGQRRLARITGTLRGALDGLVETLVQAGELLFALFTGDWKGVAQNAKELKDAFLNISDVASATGKINEAEMKLEQSMNAWTKRKSELNLERAKLEREARKNENDADARAKALAAMEKIDETLFKEEKAFLVEQIDLLGKKQALTSNDTEANKEMYELQAQLNDLEAEWIRKGMQADKINTRIINEQNKGSKEVVANKKDEVKAEQDAINKRIQLLKSELALKKEYSDEWMDINKKVIEEEYNLSVKKGEDIVTAENVKIKKLEDLQKNYTSFVTQEAEKRFTAESAITAFLQGKAKGENQSVFLEIMNEEQKALDALDSLYEAGTAEYDKVYKQITDEANRRRESASKDIDSGKSFWDLLGFDLDNQQEQAVNAAFSSAISSVNSYIDSLVKLKEQALATADARVESAQKALDAELEARNAGYANNVDKAQKELSLAKNNQRKMEEEARKAQRIQQNLDTLQQSSSLITATANLWKSFSSSGPAGVGLAIAATATMWSAFAAAKIKASQLTTEQYGQGTVELLQGGSHQSHNDIDLGKKADGTRRRAEGGEFFAVINKRNSRKYRKVIPDVIRSLNNDTFASKYLNASATMDGTLINISTTNKTDIRQLQDDVRAIKKANQNKIYTDNRGFLVMTNGNNKRVIRR